MGGDFGAIFWKKAWAIVQGIFQKLEWATVQNGHNSIFMKAWAIIVQVIFQKLVNFLKCS